MVERSAVVTAPRLLITGAGGQLGAELASRAPEAVALRRRDLDVTDRAAVRECLVHHRPDVVLHAAAMTAVDRCETEPEMAFGANALATRWLVEAADAVGARVVSVSTDYVFSGEPVGGDRPWHEWDPTGPRSVYGASKLAGERELRPCDTAVRTAWLAAPGHNNIVTTVLKLALAGSPMRFVDDQIGSPTLVPDLATELLWIAANGLTGVVHAVNEGSASWWEYISAVVAAAGADPALVSAISTAELDPPRPAPRPRYSVLNTAVLRGVGRQLRPYQDALDDLIGQFVDGVQR